MSARRRGEGRRSAGTSGGPRVPWLYAVVRDTTAQSEGVAVVLLLAMVLVGTMTVLVVGGAAIGESRQSVAVSQAEHAMRQLDAGTSSVAFDHADRASVDLGVAAGDGRLSVTDDGWLRVEVQDADTDYADPATRVFNVTLGTALYENGDTTVAYQGGGVWRSDGGATTMLARPEFHYRNGTLTIPAVSITESNSLYEDVEVVESAPFERWYPNATDGRPNRLSNAKVVVTVQSDYYEAWGQYFEDETDGIVTYDHGRETVSVKFLAIPSTFSLQNGIVATSGTGTLDLAGNGARSDSYNSSVGPYDVSAGENGDIAAVGDVELSGTDARILGDVYSGGSVSLIGNSHIEGDIHVVDNTTDFSTQGSSTYNGSLTEIDGVATIEPIDGYVRNRVESIRLSNDNTGHPSIEDGSHRLVLTSGQSGTIEAGSYYLSNLTIRDATLTLDTTDGDIVIAVRDYVDLSSTSKSAELVLVGDGNVTFLMLGRSGQDKGYHFVMEPGTSVTVPGDNSTQLRIYATSSFRANIAASNGKNNDARFVGFIYAPAGVDGTGTVEIRQAQLFGSVVTGSLMLDQGGAVHYDEALRMIDLPRSPTVSRLEYLHVGHHRVAIRER